MKVPGVTAVFASAGGGVQEEVNKGELTVSLLPTHGRAYGQEDLKAHLRRTETLREELEKLKTSAPSQETLTLGNLAINRTRREATLEGAPLPLKPQEYDLLLFFAEHKRQMLSREFILERVWGWDYIGDSRTVDVHVRWLRQKIETDPANPIRLITVRGGGYRFEG